MLAIPNVLQITYIDTACHTAVLCETRSSARRVCTCNLIAAASQTRTRVIMGSGDVDESDLFRHCRLILDLSVPANVQDKGSCFVEIE